MRTVSVRSAIQNSVPISNFNKGMAGKIFSDVRATGPKVVIKNNIPCRYMCLSELGTIDERKGIGNNDPNLIPFIEGSMWIHSEIKSPEYYF